MGTKDNPSEFDCYAAAEDDEPMFVLLARDEDAPQAVRDWVYRRHKREKQAEIAAGCEVTEVTHPMDKPKLVEALKLARQMEEWRCSKD